MTTYPTLPKGFIWKLTATAAEIWQTLRDVDDWVYSVSQYTSMDHTKYTYHDEILTSEREKPYLVRFTQRRFLEYRQELDWGDVEDVYKVLENVLRKYENYKTIPFGFQEEA